MIKTIGRLDIKTGPLTNLIDGGYCGTRNTSTEIRYSYGSGTRGKSYEEIYGYENAKVLKNKRAESNRNRDIRKKIDTSYIKGMYEINLGVTNHTLHNNVWVLISPDNNAYITRNILKTCKELKIHRKSISQLGHGVIEYYKGWRSHIYNSNDIDEIKRQLIKLYAKKDPTIYE